MTFAGAFLLCAIAAMLIKFVAEWVSIERTIEMLSGCFDGQALKNVDVGTAEGNTQPPAVRTRSCVVLQFNAEGARLGASRTRQPKTGRTAVDLDSAAVAAGQSS